MRKTSKINEREMLKIDIIDYYSYATNAEYDENAMCWKVELLRFIYKYNMLIKKNETTMGKTQMS